jgi:hypothetical protein
MSRIGKSMRRLPVAFTLASILGALWQGNAYAQPRQSGDASVCSVGGSMASAARGGSDALGILRVHCKPGDIIPIDKNNAMLVSMACDFNKAIVHAGTVILCIYMGGRDHR